MGASRSKSARVSVIVYGTACGVVSNTTERIEAKARILRFGLVVRIRFQINVFHSFLTRPYVNITEAIMPKRRSVI